MSHAEVIQGDMRLVLPTLPAESYDSCVTDAPYELTNRVPDVFVCSKCDRVLGGKDGNPDSCPRCGGALVHQRSRSGRQGSSRVEGTGPYGRHKVATKEFGNKGGFMSNKWDATGVPFDPQTWREVYRVLKPGGYLVAMGGSRTYHRLASAIEDAGFEIRDCIAEFYDSSDDAMAFIESLSTEQCELLQRALPSDNYGAWVYGQGFAKGSDTQRHIDIAVCSMSGRHFMRVLPESRKRLAEDHVCPESAQGLPWAGFDVALKPSFEPFVIARRPLSESTVAANVLKYSTGALNIDACRIEGTSRPLRELDAKPEANGAVYAGRREAGHGFDGGSKAVGETNLGRWPANTVLSHSASCVQTGTKRVKARVINRFDDGAKPFGDGAGHPYTSSPTGDENGEESVAVWNCLESCPVRLLNEQSGDKSSPWIGNENQGAKGGLMFGGSPQNVDTKPEYRDKGGAARYFATFQDKPEHLPECRPVESQEVWQCVESCPIRLLDEQTGTLTSGTGAVKRETGAGYQPNALGTESRPVGTPNIEYGDRGGASRFFYTSKASGSERNERTKAAGIKNDHETVKPLDLMRWLVRLVTRPGGRVLDPFAGSGTTLVAAIQEGMNATGIEKEDKYIPICKARIDGVQIGGLF